MGLRHTAVPIADLAVDGYPATFDNALFGDASIVIPNDVEMKLFRLLPGPEGEGTAAPSLVPLLVAERGDTPSKAGSIITWASIDLSAIAVGDRLRIIVYYEGGQAPSTTAELGTGNALTRLDFQSEGSHRLSIWSGVRPASTTPNLVLTMTGGVGSMTSGIVVVYKLPAAPSAEVAAGVAGTGAASRTFNLNTTAGGALIGAFVDTRASETIEVTGYANQLVVQAAGNAAVQMKHGFSVITTPATPQAITGTLSGNSNILGIATSLAA